MPRTINANTTIGVTLSNSADNPVAVTATIDITAGNALSGLAPTAWTIGNQGVIETTATLGNGVQLAAGGSIGNAAGALISGGRDGIYVANAAADVTDAGTITGVSDDGVQLGAGGAVSNAAGGTITGGASGVYLNGPGSVTNGAGGMISGVRHGVAIINALGTVTNAGSIVSNGATTGGVALDGGGALTNQASGYIAGGYAVYVFGGGTVTNAGTIKSTGTADTAVGFAGGAADRLIVEPGAVFIGVANGGNTLGASAVSVLELASGSGSLGGFGSSVVNFGSIVFDSGAAWTISGSTAALANGQPVSGFARGDTIELDGVATTASAFQNGTLTLANGLQLDLPGASYTFGQFQVTNDGTNTEVGIAVACFRAGTRVLTEHGETPVEALRPGLRVVSLTHRRLVAVKWIGRQRIDCARHPRPAEVWPVRIDAGAFAPGVPHRALHVSPDHAVFADGRLVPARLLVNGGAITQIPLDEVAYFHVELEQHGGLVAHGLAAESYLDTGNRAAFHNAARPLISHRRAACLQ